jgi:CHASE2 domain-containing sensor protein
LLKGRWVLIGATAEGLGDILQTTDSPMPGVEYQANVLESLHRGLLVTPLNFLAQGVVASGVLLVPLLLYGLPGLRRNWQLLLLAVVVALALCVVLLRVFYLWWPPTACLAIIGMAFLGWTLFTRSPRH